MRQKVTARSVAPVLFMLSVMSALPGCASTRQPFVVALPNGYYIERDRESNPRIVKRSGREVIPGPIAAYVVHQEIVAGAIGEWAPRAGGYPNAVPYEGTPDSRYFVLDTSSGDIERGLTEDAWRDKLEALEVPRSIEITAPVLPESRSASRAHG